MLGTAGGSDQSPRHHCIQPDWIEEEVAASTARLGTPPDVVLLHNPEFSLAAAYGERFAASAAHGSDTDADAVAMVASQLLLDACRPKAAPTGCPRRLPHQHSGCLWPARGLGFHRGEQQQPPTVLALLGVAQLFRNSLQRLGLSLQAVGHCYGVSSNPCGCWWSVSGV